MNCADWEERVALYAGGDLPPAEADEVERHVADCAGCQVLLSGLRESLALVRDAHREPIEEAHLATVRARVLSELERPARRWRWVWLPGLVAVAVVVLFVTLWPRSELRMALPPPASPSAPTVAKVVSVPAGPVQRTVQTVRTVPAPQVSGSIVVRLETNNPDVVIYWIAETKGETK
jgi:anti-sigma factor RsiW